jgi:predicted ATPase
LSVFAGGCTLETAQHVCCGHGVESSSVFDLLTALVEKSLVVAEPARDGTRYRMLETLRQYADERLTLSGARERMFTRHATYYVELGRRLREELFGPRQIEAMADVELEHNNFRAVLSRAATDPVTANAAADVAASLAFFWFLANYFTEGRHWFDWVLSLEVVQGESWSETLLHSGRALGSERDNSCHQRRVLLSDRASHCS